MVTFSQLALISMANILRNRMRSFLTALGIIIGVSAVIIMVAIGEGSKQRIQEQISSLGTNLIVVYPGAATTGGVSQGGGSITRFTFADVARLKKDCGSLAGVSEVVRSSAQVIGGDGNWFTSVYGVSPDYFVMRSWTTSSGALFTERDVQANSKVVLLGTTVSETLFGAESPVGKRIRIRNVPFTVIGVLKPKGEGGMGNDQDDLVIAPSTTVFYRLKGGQFIDMINASVTTANLMETAETEIEGILREAHRLADGEDNDFTIRNMAEITEAASAMAGTMTMLLASIAAVSLVVGGIGIMNIMLVSVTERTKEIGIRRAVGARARDVLAQVLTEAGVLSLAAGIVGTVLAILVCGILEAATDLRTSVSVVMIAVSFVFSAAVGVFFGYYPARKAAALNPIDALRYE